MEMEAVTFELYEVERGYPDLLVASVTGSLAHADREIWHYALVYGQDGPVAIRGPEGWPSRHPPFLEG